MTLTLHANMMANVRALRRKPLNALFLILSGPLTIALAAPAMANAQDRLEQASIPPAGVAQIQALLEEKQTRNPAQRKLDSQIHYSAKMARGEELAPGFVMLPSALAAVKSGRNGMVLVDISASVNPDLLSAITGVGGRLESSYARYDAVRAWLPLLACETIAARSDVRFIRPALQRVGNRQSAGVPQSSASPGSPGTGMSLLQPVPGKRVKRRLGTAPPSLVPGHLFQGVKAHGADIVHGWGIDGTGVIVGVISGGAESLQAEQNAGRLQAGISLLDNNPGAGDEGTAMLEIVHSLAPGALLVFAAAPDTEAGMAAIISRLQDEGCNIIVDDVNYPNEPAFQDGIIAQSVNAFSAAGGLYLSSAANGGNFDSNRLDGFPAPAGPRPTLGVWEGDYVNSGILHSFGTSVVNALTYKEASSPGIALQWSDPWASSCNDYDLFILDPVTYAVQAASTNIQGCLSGDDPMEFIPDNPVVTTGSLIAIVNQLPGTSTPRYLRVDTFGGSLQYGSAGSVFGHNATASAYTVAAVDVTMASGPDGRFRDNLRPEPFSSDGPRRMFYDQRGAPHTPGCFLAACKGGQVLPKVDFAAADNVETGVMLDGQTNFRGTSAAAAHAAGIAALIKSADVSLTAEDIAGAMTATALPITSYGAYQYQPGSVGAGVVMANLAVAGALTPVQVNPATVSLRAGQTHQFGAAMKGRSRAAVTWSLSPATGAGSISADGFYTAPETIPAASTVKVTATSKFDSTKSASAIVNLTTPTPNLVVYSLPGNYAAGQIGAPYTLITGNFSPVPSAGTITITDTLPSAFTATAISGAGWTCTLSTLTCTTNAVVAPGSSLPPITITINVAINAPATVANIITLSGGGAVGQTDTDYIAVIPRSPTVHIDYPTAGARLGGTVTINGWALENADLAGPNAVSAVAVFVDGTRVGTAANTVRSDVCSSAAFPGRPGCPNVGWSFDLKVSSLAQGNHTLRIDATDTAGNTGSSQLSFTAAIAPTVNIDYPTAGAKLGGTVTINGWAIENVDVVGPNAVSSVAVFVDGTLIGTAANTVRSDVCSSAGFPGRPGCPNVGWSFDLKVASLLVPGSHILKIAATDTAGNIGTSQVNFIAAVAPTVHIDYPTAGAKLGGTVTINGWAIENVDVVGPNAVSSVAVFVDGAPFGTAANTVRSDVCSAAGFPGRPGCPNVGWSFDLNVASLLAPGSHILKIVATDSAGNMGSSQVNFTAAIAPTVYVDYPSAGANLGGTVTINGWAIENADTVGPNAVSSVAVFVDGAQVGTAATTVRNDVCSSAGFPGRPGCPSVGWSFNLNVQALVSPGNHILKIVATDAAGTMGSKQVNFNAVVLPTVHIDYPTPGAALSGTAEISGWALENADIVGPNAISSVAIFVDGAQVGTASNPARPDVCSSTGFPGRPGCPNVGWSYNLNVLGLTGGTHTLQVVATDTAGIAGSNSVTFTTMPITPTVNIDNFPDYQNLSGNSVLISGWALENAYAVGPYAVSSVAVFLDGTRVGTATQTVRSDVCSSTGFPGRAGCPNVGWSYNLDISALSPSSHALQIVATDTAGNQGSTLVHFYYAQSYALFVNIDYPTDGAKLSGIVAINGWALEKIGVNPVASVAIFVDGTLVGTGAATVRNDVCTFGGPGCPNVGWTYNLDTSVLAPGTHTLNVVATDTAGNKSNNGLRQVNFTTGNLP